MGSLCLSQLKLQNASDIYTPNRRNWTQVKNGKFKGTWVAQSVKQPTLDFGSGHDLNGLWMEPQVGLHTDSTERA